MCRERTPDPSYPRGNRPLEGRGEQLPESSPVSVMEPDDTGIAGAFVSRPDDTRHLPGRPGPVVEVWSVRLRGLPLRHGFRGRTGSGSVLGALRHPTNETCDLRLPPGRRPSSEPGRRRHGGRNPCTGRPCNRNKMEVGPPTDDGSGRPCKTGDRNPDKARKDTWVATTRWTQNYGRWKSRILILGSTDSSERDEGPVTTPVHTGSREPFSPQEESSANDFFTRAISSASGPTRPAVRPAKTSGSRRCRHTTTVTSGLRVQKCRPVDARVSNSWAQDIFQTGEETGLVRTTRVPVPPGTSPCGT